MSWDFKMFLFLHQVMYHQREFYGGNVFHQNCESVCMTVQKEEVPMINVIGGT